MTLYRTLVLAFLTAITFAVSSFSYAQDFDYEEVHKILDNKQEALDSYEVIFTDDSLNTKELFNKRQEIKQIRTDVQDTTEKLRPVLDIVSADMLDLGPAPVAEEGEDPIPEPENIQQLRKELGKQKRQLEGLILQAEAIVSKSMRFQERIAELRREKFLYRILETERSPFSGTLWISAFENYEMQYSKLLLSFRDILQKDPSVYALLAALIVFLGVLIIGRYYSIRHLKSRLAELAEGRSKYKLALVSSSALISMFAVAVGFAIIQQSFMAQGIISEGNLTFSGEILIFSGFLFYVFIVTSRFYVGGIIRQGTRWIACVAALLFVLDAVLLETGGAMGTGVDLAVAQTYLFTSVYGLLMIFGSLYTYKFTEETGGSFYLPRNTFLFIGGLGLFILACNVFGYASLARYIFEKSVSLVSFLVFLAMLRAIARSTLRQIDNFFHKDADDGGERLVLFWLGLVVDVVIITLCLPLAAGIIGVEWVEIQDWVVQAFWGFNIGSVNISIANISIGVFVFLALLFGTRMVQRVLSEKILPKTRLDMSVRHSLIQLLGYLGLIISMMAGISAVGFDLTNLALIAGALSVGIGFGLQSIVSNFVSGLILLFERPIKVGDWVMLNSGEGFVKKISVRATEIETLDKTSIIVPNSELISSSVKNWTYKDRIGRVSITVGVTYDCNPHQVREILLECAKEHPSVLSHPAASVLFKDFGDSALIFDLRVFVRNIRERYDISTDLRFMIWDRLKEEGIEIPFPQRDLHIRSQSHVLELANLQNYSPEPKTSAPVETGEKINDDDE